MRHLTTFLAAVLLLASCSQPATTTPDEHQQQRDWANYVAWARYGTGHDDADGDRYTKPVDASLLAQATVIELMIEHHVDAVDGTRLYLERGAADPTVIVFAQRLIRVQTEQIAAMNDWLAANRPDGGDGSSSWVMICSTPQATNSDVGYLSNMIEHHQAAVDMYDQFVTDGLIADDHIGRMMRRIALGQIGEIEWMRQQLDALPTAA